jgi:hypothetical protein
MLDGSLLGTIKVRNKAANSHARDGADRTPQNRHKIGVRKGSVKNLERYCITPF